MLARNRRTALSLACLIAVYFAPASAADPQASTRKPLETTITQLVESGAKFNGKLVRVCASYHSGRHVTLLLERNCGLLDGTSKTLLSASLNVARESYPLSPTTQKTTQATPTYTGRWLKTPCLARGTSTSLPNSPGHSAACLLARIQNGSNSNSIE